MRAAIMGSGSIGTVLGALITKNGGEIDLIDTYDAHVKALNERGATLTGELNFTVPVRAYLPDQITGVYDLVFLLCKQTGTHDALEALKPHLSESGVVCTLQNGIPEETVACYVGRERTMGGVVIFGATWEAPGVSRCTSGGNHMQDGILIEVGELDGRITPRLREVHRVLSVAGRCAMTEHLLGLRWTKLLINATASGMSAALGCDYGGVLDSETAMYALARIGDETVKAAHADGVKLVVIDGEDFELREMIEGQTAEDKLPFYHNYWGIHHRALKASMLQDLEKGRDTEIAYINGQVCRAGLRAGVPTPYNDMVVALVKLAQDHRIVPDRAEGLRFFEALRRAEDKAARKN